MDQLFGTIERITFHNPENGFTVAKLKPPRQESLVTLVGQFPALQPGEQIRCEGSWKQTLQYGKQFEVQNYRVELPTDQKGIQKYLESGVVKGIGPAFAEKIVKTFGEKTLEIIDQNIDALFNIPGIGEKKIEKIKQSWNSHKTIRQLMVELHQYGITVSMAQKIYRTFGEDSIVRVKENPYVLAEHVAGIGFKTADSLGKTMGFTKETILRLDAGLEFLLNELVSEGHTCYLSHQFLEQAKELLEVEPSLLKERLDALAKQGKIMILSDLVWLKTLYLCELGIARELKRLLSAPCKLRTIEVEKGILWVEEKFRLKLALQQAQAVSQSMREKVHIITGGPGTGKSTIIKAILALSAKIASPARILLAAPTGRAAKRMAEITRKEAFTIHSLLQYDFISKGFKRNKDNPLECDLMIIDEMSMVDTYLFYSLLKAIPSNSRLIIVGDIYQLPSVGPGNVLKDLINSSKLSVTTLTEVFRQAQGSKIVTNAHKVNQGEFPDLRGAKDFFFIKAENGQNSVAQILDLVSTRLPRRYRYNPFEDIQVLTAMRKGVVGIESLNAELQKKLNPAKKGFHKGGFFFSEGDKVMQTRNNYTKEVFNGDLGRIEEISLEDEELIVNFDGKRVDYSFQECEELVLAYAISIHKAQGSEFKCVIIPIDPSQYVLLNRNWLYTALTRGKQLVILVGSGRAIGMAVSNEEVKKRQTYLKEQIIEALSTYNLLEAKYP